MTTHAYVARRLSALIPVLAGITLLAFGLGALAPGDPAAAIYQQIHDQPPPNQEVVDALRHELGLDAPFFVRYGRWLWAGIQGDLGKSYRTGRPVVGELADAMGITISLALIAFSFAVAAAFPIGVAAAVWRNSWLDVVVRAVSITVASMPSFWLAYLLIVLFAVKLRLLPVIGAGSWKHLVLPALTLALGGFVGLSRLIRSAMLETLGEDYVRTAVAKGVPPRLLLMRHCVRNALIPVVTMMGRNLAGLLTGAVVIETVFSRPGLGRVIVDAISFRDYPVIQGFVVMSGGLFVLINLIIDLSYVWINPRIRMG